MDFIFKNAIAINFINLNFSERCEILAMRNEVREFMLHNRIVRLDEHLRFIELLKSEKSKAYFAIKLRDLVLDSKINLACNNEFVGVFCLNRVDLINKNAFFGIYLNKNFLGNGGILMEFLKNLSKHKFGLNMLYAEVLSTNERAKKFYLKHNFRCCGILNECVKRGEDFIALEIYECKLEA